MLDALQLFKCPLGRVTCIGGLEAATHHAVRNQRHEAERRVCANPLGQTVRSSLMNNQCGHQMRDDMADIGTFHFFFTYTAISRFSS